MERLNISKFQILSSFQLKVIAIITMFIDHTGAILFPHNLIFRYIGRISFPIFCFLLVEGFLHTKNLMKYMMRMAIFAIISEIPYDIAFHNIFFEIQKQNVFITLFIGLLMLFGISRTKILAERTAIIIIAFFLAEFLSCDYGYKGLMLILVYYLFREKRELAVLAGASWNLLWNRIIRIQIYGSLAALPIIMYNGHQGKKMKYFFYIFYPAHLLLLSEIRRLFF